MNRGLVRDILTPCPPIAVNVVYSYDDVPLFNAFCCKKYKYVHVVQWEADVSKHVQAAAASRGNHATLLWIYWNGFELYDNICFRGALRGGYLPILQWLIAVQTNLTNANVGEAARMCRFDILAWAKRVGFKFDRLYFAYAAGAKHFHMLLWLQKNGCDWYEGYYRSLMMLA